MATFERHEPCPFCGSRDNLGRYSDGSAFCFGCHRTERVTDSGKRISMGQLSGQFIKEENVQLSPDLCFDYPGHVVAWLARYHVTVQEAIKHGWKYDPKRDQLVFIFNDGEGNVAVTQARNFNSERSAKQKYYNQGSPADILPIFTGVCPGGSKTLVVVEDAVSAVRVAAAGPLEGPWCHAMPCLGSYLPVRKITALKLLYDQLVVWLDADKLKEAWAIADMAKWIGLSARTIYTELDPKEHTDEQIRELVGKLD